MRNMEHEARQLLREMRGRRSQLQLARRLGYRGNPITDWERGTRFPTAEETLRALSLTGVDVRAAHRRFLPTLAVDVGAQGEHLSSWLSELRGRTELQELAQRTGRSRFAVRRWVLGKAKPRLPDFMRLLDAISGRLPEWCAELVEIERMPSLHARYLSTLAEKRLAFEAPWTEAVVRLLETRSYRRLPRHRHGFIAETLGLTLDEERACLSQLELAGLVRRGSRRYTVTAQHTVDTQGGKEALHRLKRHWADVAVERIAAAKPTDLFAYNVMSLSRADAERVRRKLQETFREIRTLVAASKPEEVAAICQLNLMLFDPEPTVERPQPARAHELQADG